MNNATSLNKVKTFKQSNLIRSRTILPDTFGNIDEILSKNKIKKFKEIRKSTDNGQLNKSNRSSIKSRYSRR